MKTLLKNRRTYRNRIGTLDDEQDMMKKEENEDEEGDHEGSNRDGEGSNNGEGNKSDSWDDMYEAYKDGHFG